MAETTVSYEKFAPVLESLDRNILFMASTLESVLNLTNGMYEIQNKQLVLAQENSERLRREADFAEVDSSEPSSATVIADDEKEPELKDNSDIAFGDILKALALAPFAFKFAKGFISAITDDLIEVTATGITGLAALIRNPINNAFARIGAATGRFAKMLTTIGKFISTTFNALPGSGILKNLLGKLAWPITLIIGAVDAVQAFINTEGDLLDKIGAGLGAFAASVVGGVLDLLKGIVAWIANKLGFENFANALGEFSFSDMIKDIFTYMFDGIRGAIDVVKDLFTFGEEDMSALGLLGKLTDIVFAPVNMAIGYVRGIFGFEDNGEPFKLNEWIVEKILQGIDKFKSIFSLNSDEEDGEEFSIKALFDATIEKVKDFFSELFDFLPSIQEIKDSLFSILPEWAQRAIGGNESEATTQTPDPAAMTDEERQAVVARRQEIENEIAEQEAQIAAGDNRDGLRRRSVIIDELNEELQSLPQVEAAEPTATVVTEEEEPRRMNRYERIRAREDRRRNRQPITPEQAAENRALMGVDVEPTGRSVEILPPENNTGIARRTEAIEQGSTEVSNRPAPVLVTGGNSARGGDTYNNGGNTNTTTIINQSSDPVRALRHVPM